MEQWKEIVLRLKAEGVSVTDTVLQLKPMFPELTDLQLREKVQSARRVKKNMSEKPVGVIGDVHLPFAHPNFLQFCVDTFKRHKVGQVVFMGDLVDLHAFSRFPKEPEAIGGYDELDRAIEGVAEYTKAFPKAKLCIGNHDIRLHQRASEIGLGSRVMKSYREIFGIPKGWVIEEEYIINNVLYRHGTGLSGDNAAINAAIKEGMSLVIGHIHSNAGARYFANKRKLIFGMSAGCGVDDKQYAFAYGRNVIKRSILGCGIVYSDTEAMFVPMDEKYFRD